MSLKAFHVIFISAAVLLAIGLGWWAIDQRQQGGESKYLLVATLSFVAAAGLVVYEVWFLRKTRKVSSW